MWHDRATTEDTERSLIASTRHGRLRAFGVRRAIEVEIETRPGVILAWGETNSHYHASEFQIDSHEDGRGVSVGE